MSDLTAIMTAIHLTALDILLLIDCIELLLNKLVIQIWILKLRSIHLKLITMVL